MDYGKLKIDNWRDLRVKGDRKQPTIYLFRHAQTYYNKNKFFTGWKDSKLTPLGKEQARKVARKLKGKRIDVAFKTHLSRSIDTLKEVLKFHPECKHVFTDDRMLERSYGKLSGSSHRAFAKKYGEEMLREIRRSYEKVPPGGESLKMVEKRVNAFLGELIPWVKKNKINAAISAHGNSMRPFRKHFEKFSIGRMVTLENPWDDYFEYKI